MKLPGVALPSDDQIVHRVGQFDKEQQLQSKPISVMTIDYKTTLGITVAVNETFLCYPVKQKLIRVLLRQASHRYLLKGFSKEILHLAYAFSKSDCQILWPKGRSAAGSLS